MLEALVRWVEVVEKEVVKVPEVEEEGWKMWWKGQRCGRGGKGAGDREEVKEMTPVFPQPVLAVPGAEGGGSHQGDGHGGQEGGAAGGVVCGASNRCQQLYSRYLLLPRYLMLPRYLLL